jgi:hypothetical protein
MAFINPPLMACALAALPGERLNQGSGTINFFRQLGGAMGTNLLVVVLELRTQFHSESLVATQTAANTVTRELLEHVVALLGSEGIPQAMQQSVALNHLSRMVYAQARTFGFQDGFLMIAILFLAALLPAWILGKSRVKN